MLIENRIEWIDQLKGLMLLLVIIEHIGDIPSYLSPTIYYWGGSAMPVYFAISGYLFSVKRPPKVFFKNKIESLLIPYILISFLLVTFDKNIYLQGGGDYFFKELERILIDGISASKGTPLWFVLTLFLINAIMYPIIRTLSNKWFLLGIAFISSIIAWKLSYNNIKLVLNLESLFTALPFFVVGYIFKEENLKYNIVTKTGGGMILVMLLIVSLLLYNSIPLLIVFHGIVPVYLSYVFGVISILFYFILFQLHFNRLMSYILKFVSLNGMTFLGFHAYFQLLVAVICKKICVVNDYKFLITFLLPLIICFLISFPINRYVPKLVGKKNPKLFIETIKNI